MTLIAAITDRKQVWMGSDSFTGNGQYALMVAEPKIFTRSLFQDGGASRDGVIIGNSGDLRGDMLMRKIILPDYDDHLDEPKDWIFKLVEIMRKEFLSYGYACKENEQESQELTVLVGIKGHIFSIWGDYDVVENAEGYMAIGSGMYFALGALHATDGLLEPKERVRAALEAASAHNAYVRPPFHVEVV